MLSDVVNDVRFKRLYRDMHFEWLQYIRSEKRLHETKYGQLYTLLYFGKLDSNAINAANIRINNRTTVLPNQYYTDAVISRFPVIGKMEEEYGESPQIVSTLVLGIATTYMENVKSLSH